MIKNVETILEFLASGHAKHFATTLDPDGMLIGVEILNGHLVIDNGLYLPVVDGITSVKVFGIARHDRYPPLLAKGLGSVKGEIADAIFIQGTPNYFHFMTIDLPQLLLLTARGAPRISAFMRHMFAPSMADMMNNLVAALAPNCEVSFSEIEEGTYALRDVRLAAHPSSSLAPLMARQLLFPLAKKKTGIKDPMKDLGPIKLFVKRAKAGNGRNLINQQQIEDWCIARGYAPVDPGTLKLEEQIILFSRATHIVGVEGAAMTNILFGFNAVDVTMLASPAVADETFFSGIAAYYAYKFQTVIGKIVGDTSGGVARSADYAIDMEAFEAAMR